MVLTNFNKYDELSNLCLLDDIKLTRFKFSEKGMFDKDVVNRIFSLLVYLDGGRVGKIFSAYYYWSVCMLKKMNTTEINNSYLSQLLKYKYLIDRNMIQKIGHLGLELPNKEVLKTYLSDYLGNKNDINDFFLFYILIDSFYKTIQICIYLVKEIKKNPPVSISEEDKLYIIKEIENLEYLERRISELDKILGKIINASDKGKYQSIHDLKIDSLVYTENKKIMTSYVKKCSLTE